MGGDNGPKQTRGNVGILRKARGLRWWSPNVFVPHGTCGAISMVTGAFLVYAALTGLANTERGTYFHVMTVVYLTATFGNAVAGYVISDSALPQARSAFRIASLLQASLVYFAFRFYFSGNPAAGKVQLAFEVPSWVLPAADKFVSIALVLLVTATLLGAWTTANRALGSLVATSVSVGCFSLYLLCGYPVQFAFGGEDWYACVMREYPMQRQGFVYYVYIPATFSFGAMLFGATLFLRKIISATFFGAFFVALILATLFSTVLLQEVHIPWVSTQKLLINCREQYASPLMVSLAEALDTSLLAQALLAKFGLDTPKPNK